MRHNIKQMYLHKITTVPEIRFDDWHYTRKNWFTDKAWNWLKKVGAIDNRIADTEYVERIAIDCTRLFDDVLRASYSLQGIGIKPKHVYMGFDKFDEYLMDPRVRDHNNYISFDVKEERQHKIYGFPVTVVPHMEGWLIV